MYMKEESVRGVAMVRGKKARKDLKGRNWTGKQEKVDGVKGSTSQGRPCEGDSIGHVALGGVESKEPRRKKRLKGDS